MFRRTATLIATTVIFVALAVSPALGWGNGGDDGNGYGTHDWVLEHAIKNVGASASWVDVNAALLTSDDPDYGPNATNVYLHAYKEKGAGRGGPQAVADEYYLVVSAYQKGDYVTASKHLGRLSHYYADLCQPYHTTMAGSSEVNSRHYPYEVAVSEMTNHYSEQTSWLSATAPKGVTDIRDSAVDAALYARSKYSALDDSVQAEGGNIKGYAYTATGLVLNRSVNDLADVIRAVPAGNGLAKAPVVMKQKMAKMTYYFPRRGTANGDIIRTEAYCYDAAGRPMPGVAVRFEWPVQGGSKSYLVYTDDNGLAFFWKAPGTGIALMKRRTVGASAVLSGVASTSNTWFMPTPVLKSGSAGLKTTVSNRSPKRNSTVKARAHVRNSAGKAVAGLPVTFYWSFKSGTVKTIATTNSSGNAYSSRNIGAAPKGYRVSVKARAYSGRYRRNSTTSFVPK